MEFSKKVKLNCSEQKWLFEVIVMLILLEEILAKQMHIINHHNLQFKYAIYWFYFNIYKRKMELLYIICYKCILTFIGYISPKCLELIFL